RTRRLRRGPPPRRAYHPCPATCSPRQHPLDGRRGLGDRPRLPRGTARHRLTLSRRPERASLARARGQALPLAPRRSRQKRHAPAQPRQPRCTASLARRLRSYDRPTRPHARPLASRRQGGRDVMTSDFLSAFTMSAEPFSKEVEDADLWMPPSKQEALDELL